MKKVYEKPRVYIETFTLNQHIASCDFVFVNSEEVNTCYATGSDSFGVFTPDDKIFASGECTVNTTDFCTYTGASNVVVFSS